MKTERVARIASQDEGGDARLLDHDIVGLAAQGEGEAQVSFRHTMIGLGH